MIIVPLSNAAKKQVPELRLQGRLGSENACPSVCRIDLPASLRISLLKLILINLNRSALVKRAVMLLNGEMAMPPMSAAADLSEKSRKYRALANPYRLAILNLVATKGKVSWVQLDRELETVFEKRINPNSLSFHLRKLIESQFLTQSGSDHRLGRLGSERKDELSAIRLK